ncbi:phage terminase small subunit [Klebsiella quasipneumoniae]|nr:terminase [Klebsiella quasipneumoniae]
MAFNALSFRRQMLNHAEKNRPGRSDAAPTHEVSDSLHLQLLALDRDLQRLRDLPQIKQRVDLKRDELLPKWAPYVERYLSAGEVYPYAVFGWCVIWLFDVGELERALDWANIAIAQDQPTPERLRSRFPAFVADQILAWAELQAESGHAIEPYFSRVFKHVREDWRLHEKHTAKFYKFAGELLLRDQTGTPAPSVITDRERLAKSLELLLVADRLWPKIGVKSRINRVEARLRQLEKEQQQADSDA